MKNVGSPQYEHLYTAIVNSTSKHNANETPVNLSADKKCSSKSEFNENNKNYRDVVNDKYTNVSVVHGKTTNESTTEITIEKERVSNESVVPKEASVFINDVTIKSSLAKSKKGKQKKGKSVKRVRFTDDPKSIPFWQRFVRFFHILWNYTRNSVTTLRTVLSKFIHLQLFVLPCSISYPCYMCLAATLI